MTALIIYLVGCVLAFGISYHSLTIYTSLSHTRKIIFATLGSLMSWIIFIADVLTKIERDLDK